MIGTRHGSARIAGRALGLGLLVAAAAVHANESAEDQEDEVRVPPAVQTCLGCHSLEESGRRGAGAAPPLQGVMGRTPSVAGVAAEQWDAQSLDRWLANPRAMAPDTDSRFPGYADAAMRETVIRFLDGLE